MPMGRFVPYSMLIATLSAAILGCGTTRSTDTVRAASEMLLVSQAVDEAVTQIDFSALRGKTVFLDEQYLDKVVDKGYLVSSIRQHLLAHGALLKDERERATFIVEARTGGLGTDRHSLLIGTPQITIPSIVAVPITNIPEIALVKKTDQKGVAKLAVFAYNRETGQALWQSGMVESTSTLKDTWVFGAGPFSRGSIRRRTELAGQPLPVIPVPYPFAETEAPPAEKAGVTPAEARVYSESEASDSGFVGLGSLAGPAAVVSRPSTLPNPMNPPGSRTNSLMPLINR